MLGQDCAYAIRSLGNRPGFTAAVVLTLAVGIGATTATFGVVNAVLLEPLPIRDQERVVGIQGEDRTKPDPRVGMTYEVVWRLEQARALTEVAAIRPSLEPTGADPFAVRAGDRLTSLGVTLVAGNFFRVLGVAPAAGRLLVPDDDAPGAPRAAVLSYRAWRREFGGDSGVVGRTLVFAGAPHTVVGVAPQGFNYPKGTELWTTLAQLFLARGAPKPDEGSFELVGRLRPGTTVEQAAAEVTSVLRGASAPRLGPPGARVATVRPLAELVVGDLRPGLLILTAAVALLLLMVWVNVAGLLLTRGLVRAPELAVRAALGASRGRLMAQLLTEHAVLAAAGGTLGVALGAALLQVAPVLAPPGLPRFDEVRLDGRTLAAAAVVMVLSVVAFGLAPAVLAARRDPEGALRSGSRMFTGTRRAARARQLVVVVQVALALVVLVGAGLLGRSLERLQRLDLGFEPERLLFVVIGSGVDPVAASVSGAEQEARLRAVFDAFAERLPGVPGVTGVTSAYSLPFTGAGPDVPYTVEGQGPEAAERNPRVDLNPGLDDFVRTVGLRLVRGRAFTPADRAGAPPVVVVSEGLARQGWPGQNPLGQRIRLGRRDSTWRTVIGVVGDTRYRDLPAAPRPAIYRPLRQDPNALFTAMWAVRTTGEPRQALPAIRRVLREADPSAGIQFAASGRELTAEPLARPRLLAAVLAALSAVSVLLAAVGLFGVLAAIVRQRAHEMAVRMALGATPAGVRALVLRHAALLAGAGVLVGLALALAGTRTLRAVLFDVSPTDPLTLAGVAGLLLVVAMVAAAVPARRAARLDPLAVLRAE